MPFTDFVDFKATIRLDTPSLRLLPLELTHVTGAYIAGLNDPDVNRFLVDVKRQHQTRETVAGFIETSRTSPTAVLFGIFLKKDANLHIGSVRLANISAYHFCADVGICLFNKDCWRQGYALEALKAVVRFAFQDLGLHYLEAGVYCDNTGSARLFNKAGFERLHTLRNKYRNADAFTDVYIYGIYNHHFPMATLTARVTK